VARRAGRHPGDGTARNAVGRHRAQPHVRELAPEPPRQARALARAARPRRRRARRARRHRGAAAPRLAGRLCGRRRQPIVCLALSYYGLRITLGRQALAATSYVADLDREPPVDILDNVAAHVTEKAKVTDILEEHAS